MLVPVETLDWLGNFSVSLFRALLQVLGNSFFSLGSRGGGGGAVVTDS